jgi:hypothetical protein
LIELFQRRGLLPRTLKFFATLGDVDGVRACLDTNADDLAAVNEAFMYACHLKQATTAALLLDRAITIDAELGRRIDSGPGRSSFIHYFIENTPDVRPRPDPAGPWQAFVKQQVEGALRDGDLTSFVDGLQRESWLLSEAQVDFQVRLIEGSVAGPYDVSAEKGDAAFLKAILERAASLPASQLRSHARVLSCLKPSCRCHSAMRSSCWRANMGFQAGRTCLKK